MTTIDSKSAEAAGYAASLAAQYLVVLREQGLALDGLEFLEVGPGDNLIHAFALKAAGIRVSITDRFMTAWDQFDERVAAIFVERWHPEAKGVIADALKAGGYPFRMFQEPAENMRSVEDRSFDAVFSHAALEHVYDLPSVARELYRVTRPNGLNRHQIDLRDHLDFNKPLEFLLVDDDEFQRSFKDARWKQGNRFRLSEIVHIFYEAGFYLFDIQPNATVDFSYLADLASRLRAAKHTRYASWPIGDLVITGARFLWRRPSLR